MEAAKPRAKDRTSVHSVRCPDAVWNSAKERAEREDVSMNYVLTQILEGYGAGAVSLPTVTVTKEFDQGAVSVSA